METFKRVVSLLLCFVMLVGVVPFGAMATETTEPETTETIPVVEETEEVTDSTDPTGETEEVTDEEHQPAVQADDENQVPQEATGNGTVTSKKTVYVLTSSISAGKSYLIVNSNSTGSNSKYALKNNNNSVGSQSVTINSGDNKTGNKVYIELEDATNALWTTSGSSSTTLKNGAYYLTTTGSSGSYSLNLTTGTPSKTWSWSSDNNRLSTVPGSRTTYYLYCNNGSWGLNNDEKNIYFYECTEIEVETDVSGTYSIAGTDLTKVVTNGTTATLSSTLTFTPNSGEVTTTDVSASATYEKVSGADIFSGINGNTVTFNGTYGEAVVKVSYTTDFGVVTNFITVTAEEPSYEIEITDKDDNIVTSTIVIKGDDAMNAGYQLGTKLYYAEAEETIEASKIRWESNKTNIATVDENGKVTFVGGEGNVIITVYYEYAEGKTVTDEVTISVAKTTYNVPDDGTNDFPEYPNQGSIRIDKTGVALGNFSQTGIAQMELSMTGVPYGTSVPTDIVIMVDMTSSMNENDITAAKLAVQELIETLVYDKENNAYDENMHLFVSSFSSGTSDKNIKIIDHLYDVTVESAAELTAAKNAITDSQNGFRDDRHSTTGTHYGVALSDVYATLNRAGHADNQFVIFLTDGEPNQYYYLNGNTYANYESSSHSNWFDTNGNVTSNFKTEYYTYLFKTEGIPVYTIGANLGSTSNASYLINHMSSNYSPDGKTATGETKYSFTCTTSGGITNEVLEIFRGIGESIREAAVDVVVEDKIADEYTMNFALPTNVTKDEAGTDSFYMQVVQYDLDENNEREANPDVLEKFLFNANGTVTHTVKGITCGNSCSHVTYSSGKVSSIKGTYFEYTRTVKADGTDEEYIVWNAEKLDRTELALQYFLYLDNSAGVAAADQVEPGTYNTNAYAHITYTNHLGNECRQYFPVPSLTWRGAKVTYVFYLVNAQGQPVNRAGKVIPFAEAIYVTDPVTYDVTWNEIDGQKNLLAADLMASANVPDVYSLYDADASYTVRVYETEGVDTVEKNGNYFQITGSNNKLIDSAMDSDTTVDNSTTKVFNTKAGQKYDKYGVYSAHDVGTQLTAGDKKTITTTVKADDIDYANTTVAFAVVWNQNLTPDTVVIDFGLDVVIDVYENDGLAATVVGVRAQAPNGVAPNSGRYTAAKAQSADVKIGDMKIGTASVENNTSVRFSLDKTNGMQMKTPVEFFYEAEVNYYEGNTLNTVNMYSSVTVIPATTIYYEDEFVTLESYTWDYDADNWAQVQQGNNAFVWSQDGTTINATQDQDRPGVSQISKDLDADNVYGYDSAYANSSSTFSMGSAMKAHVDYDNYGTAKFTFAGTGFDVISLTSNKTGTIFVTVYEMEDGVIKTDADGNKVVANYPTKDADGNAVTKKCQFVVDTFYGYARKMVKITYEFNNGAWEVKEKVDITALQTDEPKPQNPTQGTTYSIYEYEWYTVDSNSPNALYQVPVMKVEGLPYGTYTAVIEAMYDTAFDHKQYGTGESYDFYLDAIRVYDPANDGANNETVEDAYKADGEYLPEYYELRNWLIAADTFWATQNQSGAKATQGIVFFDGAVENVGAGASNSVTDYKNFGPNNELYLAPGQGITFNLDGDAVAPDGYIAESIQLAMKTVGGTSYAKVYDAKTTAAADVTAMEIKTATDLYYDISDLNNGNVVIMNTGDSILSITNIKITFQEAFGNIVFSEGDVFTVSAASVETALMSLRSVPVVDEPADEPTDEPIVEPEEDPVPVFDPEYLKVTSSAKSVKEGQKIDITVTTSADVEAVSIDGTMVKRGKYNKKDKTYTWTAKITTKASDVGTKTIEVVAYDEDGVASEAETVEVTVTAKAAKPVKPAKGGKK